ncbi:MAG: YbjQ family protein [Planctomycetota bacterium]
MIAASTDSIQGKRVVRTLGLVSGAVTRSPGLLPSLVATIKNFFGGELEEFTKTLAEAREQALDRMLEQARSQGANAVLSVRFASAEIASFAAEIMVYGTAVIVEDEGEGGKA